MRAPRPVRGRARYRPGSKATLAIRLGSTSSAMASALARNFSTSFSALANTCACRRGRVSVAVNGQRHCGLFPLPGGLPEGLDKLGTFSGPCEPSRARASKSVGRAASTSWPATSLLSAVAVPVLEIVEDLERDAEVLAELGDHLLVRLRPARPGARRRRAPPRTPGPSSGRRSSGRPAASASCLPRRARAARPPGLPTVSGARRPAG